jgi:hypothetical protein
LNEGRLTLTAKDGLMRSTSREKTEYYMRNLVRTRYPELILQKAALGHSFDWVSDDEFLHELLLPRFNQNEVSEPLTSSREQRLASTRHRRYIWIGNEEVLASNQ